MRKIDEESYNQIEEYIKQKYITKRKHPTEELYIYNYTNKCQYDRKWDKITRMCRGLILDGEHNIISRPFPKFFNIEELDELPPYNTYDVYEKYDGSLGISYFVNGKLGITTRGSFISEPAQWATKNFNKIYSNISYFKEGYTYLFEIIYPDNKIVVNYKTTEDLVLLAVIHTETGKELDLTLFGHFHIAKKYENKKLSDLKNENVKNREGYVIKYPDNTRIKIKFEDYIKLHRILMKLNVKTIWECLRDNTLDELIKEIPDEYYPYINKEKENFITQFNAIEKEAILIYNKYKGLNQKEYAFTVKDMNINPILFNLYKNKEYKELIWNRIKPSIGDDLNGNV